MLKTLQQVYCEQHGVSPESFETNVFRHCLYPHARLLAWVPRLFDPGFFYFDFAAIRQMAKATDLRQAADEISAYIDRNRCERTFLHDIMRVRVSGKRLLNLARQYLPTTPSKVSL